MQEQKEELNSPSDAQEPKIKHPRIDEHEAKSSEPDASYAAKFAQIGKEIAEQEQKLRELEAKKEALLKTVKREAQKLKISICPFEEFWETYFPNEKREKVPIPKQVFLNALKIEMGIDEKNAAYAVIDKILPIESQYRPKVSFLRAKALFDCFGHGPLKSRVANIASLYDQKRFIQPWFWGSVSEATVDNALRTLSEDMGYIVRVNHGEPGTLTLSYVVWEYDQHNNPLPEKNIYRIKIEYKNFLEDFLGKGISHSGFMIKSVGNPLGPIKRAVGPYASIADAIQYLDTNGIIGRALPYPSSVYSQSAASSGYVEIPPTFFSVISRAAAAAAGTLLDPDVPPPSPLTRAPHRGSSFD